MEEIEKLQSYELNLVDENDKINEMFARVDDTANICTANEIVIENNIASIHQENIGVCYDNYDMGF
jgi:hypothetical protein